VGRLADSSWLDRDPTTGVAVVVGRHRLASDVVGELMDDLAIADVRIVVCDLSGMAVTPRSMGQVFAPVADYLAAWPGTLVVVCVPDTARHAEMVDAAIAGRLLVHRTMEAGVREARELTVPLEQTSTLLAPVPTAAADARDFVRRTLRDWQLLDMSWPASLVCSELVTNSLLYSASVVDLTLTRVPTRVRVAVHDHGGGAPAIPGGTEAEATARLTGRGLQLIEAVSLAWGVFPTRPRGKTVWALLDAAA
jgi:anti-sigma regulatory factor (Ser/Thr protein kinase)